MAHLNLNRIDLAFGHHLVVRLGSRLVRMGAECLDELDEPDLVRILTEPKNSIVKQQVKLFVMKRNQLFLKA